MLAVLTPQTLGGVQTQLAPLGKPKAIAFLRKTVARGYHTYVYRVVWSGVALDESFALDSNGKIAGWVFHPAEATTPAPSESASALPAASATP